MKPRSTNVNRHRPLNPDALSQRFLRLREVDPLPTENEVDNEGYESGGDCWNPWYADGLHYNEEDLVATWNQLLGWPGAVLGDRVPNLDWSGLAVPESTATNLVVRPPRCRWSPEELPAVLRNQLHAIDPLRPFMLPPALRVEGASLAPFRLVAQKYFTRKQERTRRDGMYIAGGMVLALYLSPFWVREPADFTVTEDSELPGAMADFMEHLFAAHPVPPCLRNAWTARWYGEIPNLTWITWFILSGQGASIHRAGSVFGWKASLPLLHSLQDAPAHLSPADGILWAEVRRLDGSETEIERLRLHAEYAYSPVFFDRDRAEGQEPPVHAFAAFWADTLRWLARYRADLTDEMCLRILPWAADRYRAQMQTDRPFSWKRRSPARAWQLTREWEREIDLVKPSLRWESLGLDWKWADGCKEVWSIRELLSSMELHREASAMSHCVSSFAMRCFNRDSAIFSLCCSGERRLTVEIDPRSRRIVQARGRLNRSPEPEETKRIQEWQEMITPLTADQKT